MACRSSCPTQDHKSWGECAKGVLVGYCGRRGQDYTAQKKDDKELAFFRQAVSDGLMPEGTRTHQIRKAYEEAEKG